MINKLFIGGLAYSVTDSQLQELFAQFGSVVSAKVITDRYTGQGKGFGFVEMSSEEEAKLAMNKLNNTSFSGRNIVVNEARPREERSQNNRGYKPGRNDY
jgi:RNA recognition motif-containing protein